MQKIKFTFLVLPHIHLMDLAGPDQALLEAIEYGAPFEVEYCGIGMSPVSSGGLKLGAIKHFSEVEPGGASNYLVIPGASLQYLLSHAFLQEKMLFDWIKKCYQQGVQLVSICAGAFVLGHCGLLDHTRCTTHFKQTSHLQERYPKAMVLENILFTEDKNIYTSAGIASGIDLILYLIEKHLGGYFTHKVAREMVVYNRRDGQDAQQSVMLQFRNHIHQGIHAVQDYVIENIHLRHSLLDLAERANMSERNFTRVFRKETGISVSAFINTIRKATILQLLRNPDLTKSQIAQKVGLESERQLNRILVDAAPMVHK